MTCAARERSLVRTPLLVTSAAAWILLVLEPRGIALPALCSAGMRSTASHSASLSLLAELNRPAALTVGWVLMLAAMMVPLLTAPLRHVRDRSFAQRRARAIALFVAGYVVMWMAAGVVLIVLLLTIGLAVPDRSLPLAVVMIVALVWQCSAVKQRCLNRCHFHPELAASGLAADLGAIQFGLTHGVWCIGSCWALMLPPLLVFRGHVVMMAAVALWLSAERLDGPRVPRWRLRGPGKAARIVVAQTQMCLQRRLGGSFTAPR